MVIEEFDCVGCRQIVILRKIFIVLSIRIFWSSIEIILSLLPVVGSVGPRVTRSIWLVLSIWVWSSAHISVEASLSIGCLIVLIPISGLLIKTLRTKVRSSSLIVVMSENCAAPLVFPCLLSFNLIIVSFSSAVHERVSISSAIWTEPRHILSWFVIPVRRSRIRLVHLLFFE